MSGCLSTITPTAADVQLARESSRRLTKYAGQGQEVKAQLIPEGSAGNEEPVVIPESIFRLVCDALNELAHGNAVAMAPLHKELSPNEAADLLNVSRPFLVGLLEKGEIPYRMVGTHRRVPLLPLLAYKQRSNAQQLKAIEALVADAEEQDMGY